MMSLNSTVQCSSCLFLAQQRVNTGCRTVPEKDTDPAPQWPGDSFGKFTEFVFKDEVLTWVHVYCMQATIDFVVAASVSISRSHQ